MFPVPTNLLRYHNLLVSEISLAEYSYACSRKILTLSETLRTVHFDHRSEVELGTEYRQYRQSGG